MTNDTINTNIGGYVVKVAYGNTSKITLAANEQQENRDMQENEGTMKILYPKLVQQD